MPVSTYRLQLGADLTLDDAAERVPYLAVARRHARVPVADPAGGARVDARVRRRRPRRDRARARRAATALRAPGGGGARRGPRAGPRHRAEPHGGADARVAQPRAVVGARRGPRLALRGLVRRRLVRGRRRGAHAGARRPHRRGAGPRRAARSTRSRSPARARAPSCATTTTSSRSGRAPSRSPWPSWSSASTTGSRTGAWPTRSSTTGGSSTSARCSRSASRTRPCSTRRTRSSCRCSRTARSTACASTTRTVSPTRRATWRGCARRAAARGSSSRRSSRATRRCPPTGRPPARTGYEALWRIQQTFVDPGGAAVLGAVMHRLTGDTSDAFPAMAEEAKREIVDGPLYAEVHRLTSLAADICRDDLRLRDHTWRALRGLPDRAARRVRPLPRLRRAGRARAPGVARGHAGGRARTRAPGSSAERSATMDVVVDLLLGREVGSAGRTRGARRDELDRAVPADLRRRHGQGRRGHRVLPLDPPDGPVRGRRRARAVRAHARRTCRRGPPQMQVSAPLGMTTLSTHDTKRGEDTRARLGVLSELPARVVGARRRPARGVGPVPQRAARRPHRVPALADAGGHLDRRRPDRRGPPRRVPDQGDPRGEEPDHLDGAGRAVRGRGARRRAAGAGRPDGRRAVRRLGAAHPARPSVRRPSAPSSSS